MMQYFWAWLPFAIIVLGLAGQTWLIERHERRRRKEEPDRDEALFKRIEKVVTEGAERNEAADADRARRDFEELNRRLTGLVADLTALDGELKATKAQLDDVKGELGRVKTQLQDLKSQRGVTGQEVASDETGASGGNALETEPAAAGATSGADVAEESPSAAELRRDVNLFLNDQPLPDRIEFLTKYRGTPFMVDKHKRTLVSSAGGELMLVLHNQERFILPGEQIFDQRAQYKKHVEMLSTDVAQCYDLEVDGSGNLQIARLPTWDSGSKIIRKGLITGLVVV